MSIPSQLDPVNAAPVRPRRLDRAAALFIPGLCAVAVAVVSVPTRAQPAAAQRTDLDNAINRALEFLQRTQDPNDGSWKALRGQDNTAITALPVLALLSAGHVPGEGSYGATVDKAIRWVLSRQQPGGLLAVPGHHEMYHHGISTLMLAEAAGMTDGTLAGEVREALQKAIKIILQAQRLSQGSHHGGWRYHVEERLDVPPADISVTGWQIMALRAAKNVGCDVPAERIDAAVGYIQRCQDPTTGGFCYLPASRATPACTGTSILALSLCGKDLHHRPELLKAGTYLLQNPPRWGRASSSFFYEVYYGSQASFQLGGNYWKFYRKELHDTLLPNQQKDSGAWYGLEAQLWGPAYCTAMAVLSLTVEYRFLPIYQRGDETGEDRK